MEDIKANNNVISMILEDHVFVNKIQLAQSDAEVVQLVNDHGFNVDENSLIDHLKAHPDFDGMSHCEIFFPDNEKRQDRLKELSNDISMWIHDFAEAKAAFDSSIAELNEKFREKFKAIGIEPPKTVPITLADKWLLNAVEKISPIMVYFPVHKALTKVGAVWLVKTGRMASVEAVAKLGLPRWMKIGRFGGGVLATIALELLIDAVDGAITRSNLRKGIHEILPGRIETQKAVMIVKIALAAFGNIKKALDDLGEVVEKPTEGQYLKLIDKKIATFKAEADKVTDQVVINYLTSLDKGRNSWTNEDVAS